MVASKGTVRVSLHVEGFGGSSDEELRIDRAEWDAMSVSERTELIDNAAEEHACNYVTWGWDIHDADDMSQTSVLTLPAWSKAK